MLLLCHESKAVAIVVQQRQNNLLLTLIEGIKMKKFILAIFILLGIGTGVIACTPQNNNASAKNTTIVKQTNRYYDDISTKTWYVKNGKEHIFGYIYQPKNFSGKKKVAILSHGLNGNFKEMKPYAKNLAHHGYLTYAFDYPGGGSKTKSTGLKTTQMSLFTEEKDLLAVIKAISQRNDVRKNKILLVGGSQGGAVSALTASRHPQQIGALALMYPAFSITDYAQSAFRNYSDVPQTVNLFGFKLGKIYFKHLFDMDLTKLATKFTGPVLIVHGKQDIVVPYQYSRTAAHNFKNAELKLLPHAGHDFTGASRAKVIKYLDHFIKKLH